MIPVKSASSIVMLLGLAVTYLFLPTGSAVSVFHTAAIGAAFAIGLGFLVEAKNVRSLIRTDVLMILGLFGLTLIEFFFPQEALRGMLTASSATRGVEALFLGFAGIIVGRHFVSSPRAPSIMMPTVDWNAKTLFRIYLVAFFAGFIHMLWSVGFDPIELVTQMLRPRFSQPWSRGALGGALDMLAVLANLLLYLVPAIAGAALAQPARFTPFQKTIFVLGLLFTLFSGFASGTRNVFCLYVIIFVIAYVLRRPNITWKRVTLLSAMAAALLYLAAYYMLQFRTVGLENYIEHGHAAGAGYRKETLFIDNNLPVISRLTDLFPDRYNYVGMEFAIFALLRPVPRALWPSKPEKLSLSTEDALGLEGLTISSTFVGEAYMMGGLIAVAIVGLILGGLAGWWNRFGLQLNSNVAIVLYASGFFAAVISMRSLLFATTAMLPTIALWLYAKYWRRGTSRRAGVPPQGPPGPYRGPPRPYQGSRGPYQGPPRPLQGPPGQDTWSRKLPSSHRNRSP